MNNKKGLNVLSLFDGMSCGRIALERSGIKINNYFCSDIDKYALKIAQKNYPDSIYLGDVLDFDSWDLPDIDLIIGGSPCQSISNMGDGSGLDGKSKLFFHYVACLQKFRPKYFLLENVAGNKKAIASISERMATRPVLINSNLVSGQNRPRNYWTNIPMIKTIDGITYDMSQPLDKGINLIDILEDGIPDASLIGKGRKKWLSSPGGFRALQKRYAAIDPIKALCLTRRSDPSWNSNYVTRDKTLTRLTPVEYERLQTVPDNYTSGVSNLQRYMMLGNGWTVDVISHILSNIPFNESGSLVETESKLIDTIAINNKKELDKIFMLSKEEIISIK